MWFLLFLVLACGSNKTELDWYHLEFTCEDVQESDGGWVRGEEPLLESPPIVIQTSYEGHYEDGTTIDYGFFPSYTLKIEDDGTWEYLMVCGRIYVGPDDQYANVDVIHVAMALERSEE